MEKNIEENIEENIEKPTKKRRYMDTFNNQSEIFIQENQSYLLMSENELLHKLDNLENLFSIMMNNIQSLNNELIKIENQIEDIKDNNEIKENDEILCKDLENLVILEENNEDEYMNSYFS